MIHFVWNLDHKSNNLFEIQKLIAKIQLFYPIAYTEISLFDQATYDLEVRESRKMLNKLKLFRVMNDDQKQFIQDRLVKLENQSRFHMESNLQWMWFGISNWSRSCVLRCINGK